MEFQLNLFFYPNPIQSYDSVSYFVSRLRDFYAPSQFLSIYPIVSFLLIISLAFIIRFILIFSFPPPLLAKFLIGVNVVHNHPFAGEECLRSCSNYLLAHETASNTHFHSAPEKPYFRVLRFNLFSCFTLTNYYLTRFKQLTDYYLTRFKQKWFRPPFLPS